MRDMRAARKKVCEEGQCRNCHRTGDLDPCHVVPRSRLQAEEGAEDPRNAAMSGRQSELSAMRDELRAMQPRRVA